MASKTQVVWNRPSRRRDPRRLSALPVDITVVRANRSDRLPGRCLNVSLRGFGASLAGELRAGEVVGIELALPQGQRRWRADAVVRHRRQLDHGFEFSDLADSQQEPLMEWLRSGEPEPELAAAFGDLQLPPENSLPARNEMRKPWARPAWLVVLLALAFAAGVAWRWQNGWREIESGAHPKPRATRKIAPETRVPAEEMQKRLVRRVDPDYPEAARAQNLSGVIVLDIVIGRDGSVIEVNPESGPEVLTRAAAEAVRWWQFEPFQVDGQPAVVGTTVAVEFKPEAAN
jgi:TonB family protein